MNSPLELYRFLENHHEFVEVGALEGVQIDLRYATENNFMNENIYGEFDRAFLHFHAAEKLQNALNLLRDQYPHLKLLLLDCLRPRSAQQKLWDKVVNTNQEKYVANPQRGSMHNFGVAIDLTLVDENGHELDMGAGFDEFTDKAEPRHEARLLQEGILQPAQIENRLILRNTMEAAGFFHLPHEWWHFDSESDSALVRSTFTIVE